MKLIEKINKTKKMISLIDDNKEYVCNFDNEKVSGIEAKKHLKECIRDWKTLSPDLECSERLVYNV